MRHVVVVGGGIFGVTAAITLRRRGDSVTLLDPGPLPHPLAESTDMSKVVRLDYGSDELYHSMAERALQGWRHWNEGWDVPLFHETGVLFMTQTPMAAGGLEHDSYEELTRRGYDLERLDANTLRRRFAAWGQGSRQFVDGYFNPAGGWVASGPVVTELLREAQAAGVVIRAGFACEKLLESDSACTGVLNVAGEKVAADVVVLAAGAWTPKVAPWLADDLRPVGQPVFHLAPKDVRPFLAPQFPVFNADIAKTGWYGFPAHNGIVKLANHGVGRPFNPSCKDRQVSAADESALRVFLAETLPTLADAPVVATRTCVYGDTWDQHFWIAPDPERAGLVVAAGGSGHAFKYAPLLGDLIADATQGIVVPRFRWRPDVRRAPGQEQARHRG